MLLCNHLQLRYFVAGESKFSSRALKIFPIGCRKKQIGGWTPDCSGKVWILRENQSWFNSQ